MIPFPAITGPSYQLASLKAENELSINVYRERIESGEGIGQFAMNKSPGLTPKLFGLGAGCWRGFYELNDFVFGVIDSSLYVFTSTALSAPFTGIANDTRPVQMAASPNTLMVVSAGHLYRINSNALTEITLSFTPIGVASLKNYFIVLSSTMQQLYWSTDDGETFPAGNVQTAEASANNMLAIRAINQMLCLVGNRITQWFAVGQNPNAPFVPLDNGVMRSGTVAAASVEELGSSLLWLERQKEGQYTVIMTNGFTPVKVSNNYVSNKIRSLAASSTVEDAIGMSYRLNDQEFYRLTFPAADYTLEYNKTLNEWECTLAWDWITGQYHRHRANCIVSAFGTLIAGDYANGELYEMSPDTYHDFGFPIRYNRRTPHLAQDGKRIAISRLQLWMETGVGLTSPLWLNDYSQDLATFTAAVGVQQGLGNVTGSQATALLAIYSVQPYDITLALPESPVMTPLGFYEWGRDPQITMKYSNNSGKDGSWSDDMNCSLGRAGDDPDVYWDRLGADNDFVVDLSGDDPCQLSISSAWIEAEELLS